MDVSRLYIGKPKYSFHFMNKEDKSVLKYPMAPNEKCQGQDCLIVTFFLFSPVGQV